MKNVGFIGWRGMVGSVLMSRMNEENDFSVINPVFFSTSQHGQPAPVFGGHSQGTLQDAYDIDALTSLDIIVTCQGGTIPVMFIHVCVKRDGKATGLMQPRRFEWPMRRLLSLIQ